MPKIETYNFDENISDNDFLLGTDVDEDNKTKSYRIRTLINKIKAEVELTAFIQVETLPTEDIQLNTIYILPNGDWNYYNGTIWLSNSNRPYKVYTALLTQSGTNAPVATVLENTLGGNVVWSREDVGVYTGVLNGAFIQDKTFLYSKNKVYSSDDSTEYSLSDSDINKAYVTTTVAGALEDGVMLRTPIEIRVYN